MDENTTQLNQQQTTHFYLFFQRNLTVRKDQEAPNCEYTFSFHKG
jgi:hypothetical protein